MNAEEIILSNIRTRRSVFPASYLGKAIENETLMQLLACANEAPSHKKTQPWQFVVFKEKGLASLATQMAGLYKQHTAESQYLEKKHEAIKQKILLSAAVIAINIKYSGIVPKWEEIAALGCAVQNLWLAAHAKGIGGYWSSPTTLRFLNEYLDLGENEECLGLFYLGYHKEELRTIVRQPIEEKIKWVLD